MEHKILQSKGFKKTKIEKKSFILLILFIVICMFLCNCTGKADVTAPQQIDEDPVLEQMEEHYDEELDEEESDEESEEKADDKFVPYIPTTLQGEAYPKLYNLVDDFDHSKNNRSLKDLSFCLSDEYFIETESENKFFKVFNACDLKKVGACAVSVLVEPLEVLVFHMETLDGKKEQILMMHVFLNDFLSDERVEVVTVFSEQIGEYYIPGAMFKFENSVRFIFVFMNETNVYSIQFVSYESYFANAHAYIIKDLINSIYISNS